MPTTPRSVIDDAALAHFEQEGYLVLPGVIPPDHLQLLREECAYFMGYMDSRMDAGLVDEGALSARDNRYFINNLYRYSHRLWQFIFSDLMADICRRTLGPEAFLFHEQWVIKGPEKGKSFAWHQDSGYVKAVDPETTHAPYLTCWCTLDDVNADNGTVYLLPHTRGGTKGHIITHMRDVRTNDLVGYTGPDAGVEIDVPAGSIVAFSSYNLHRSGQNTTPRMRRVYLPQYTAAPVVNTQTGERMNLAVPFLESGKIIYDHDKDRAAAWGGVDRPRAAA